MKKPFGKYESLNETIRRAADKQEYQEVLREVETFFNSFEDPKVRVALLASLGKTEKSGFKGFSLSEEVVFHTQPIDVRRLGLRNPKSDLPVIAEEFGITLFALLKRASERRSQLFTRVTLLPDHIIALGAQRFIRQGNTTGLVFFDQNFGEYHASPYAGGFKVGKFVFT